MAAMRTFFGPVLYQKDVRNTTPPILKLVVPLNFITLYLVYIPEEWTEQDKYLVKTLAETSKKALAGSPTVSRQIQ